MRQSIEVDIDAPAERVFAVMSDITRWPEWTSTVTSIRQLTPGPISLGTRALIRQPKFPPAMWKVTAIEPGRGFVWVSRAPGLRVTASHRADPRNGGARATLALEFAGLLGPWFGRMTRDINQRYLEIEAAGLKARCERA